MSVTLFEDKDFRGRSQAFAKDKANLKDTNVGNHPSSIKITGDDEAVLLFKKEDWDGGALYLRGHAEIDDLGSKKAGGRQGFGNAVTSLRRTPFTLDLNVSVVCAADGRLPGKWTSREHAEIDISKAVAIANWFYQDQRALLALKLARTTFRTSGEKYDLKGTEHWHFPGEWKQPGEVDVVFVNSFRKEGTGGKGKFPCFGNVVIIACKVDTGNGVLTDLSLDDKAEILAHELGHYLGLSHRTSGKDSDNLMFEATDIDDVLSGKHLTADQIEELHTRLSKNISRKGDRNE